MFRMIAVILLLVPLPAAASADDLRESAVRFAGAPVRLDERIAVPDCPTGFTFSWEPGSRAGLHARCPGNGWNIRLDVAASESRPAIRRGQFLQVEVEGAGYRVNAEGVVEAVNLRDGSVTLRNSVSGRRFFATIGDSGKIFVKR